MKTKKTYAEKLKDPRWQKKRLEVFELSGFECGNCGDAKSELQVHHPAYRKGREPWDYRADELQCLCKTCHDKATANDSFLREVIFCDPSNWIVFLDSVKSGDVVEASNAISRMMANYSLTCGEEDYSIWNSLYFIPQQSRGGLTAAMVEVFESNGLPT